MQILRKLIWLSLGGLHSGLLLALIGCSGTPPLDAGGSRSDTPPVDQGITSEDKSEPAEPEPVIETSVIPQEESRPNAASTRQQTPQGATRVEQSGDPEQNVGNASLRLAYLSEVQKTLERSTVNPDAQLSGTVLIDLTIASSGQVLTREVEKSSGSKVLDDAAITALDRAAPFPPMPRGVAKGPLKLQVPVEFVTR
jgi:periplasmic protein TonB